MSIIPPNEFILYIVIFLSGYSSIILLFVGDSEDEQEKRRNIIWKRTAGVATILVVFCSFLIQYNEIKDDKKTDNLINGISKSVQAKGEETIDRLDDLIQTMDGLNNFVNNAQDLIARGKIDLDKIALLNRQLNRYNKNREKDIKNEKPKYLIPSNKMKWIPIDSMRKALRVRFDQKGTYDALNFHVKGLFIGMDGHPTSTSGKKITQNLFNRFVPYEGILSSPKDLLGQSNRELNLLGVPENDLKTFQNGYLLIKIYWNDPLNYKKKEKSFFFVYKPENSDSSNTIFFSAEDTEEVETRKFIKKNKIKF